MAVLFGTGAAAQAPAPVVTVNREEVESSLAFAEKRDHEWYLPVLPIARALHAEVAFDPSALSVAVTSPLDGTVTVYDGLQGEVLREGVVLLTVPSGLAIGTNPADLLLPLSLVSLLFDVRVQVSPLEDEITLLSRQAASADVAGLPVVGLQELRYHGYANHGVGPTNAGMTVENRTRVGEGSLETRLFGQAAESEDPILRSWSASWLDGRGNAWTVGDLRGRQQLRWLNTVGRGARWEGERSRGRDRFTVSYLNLASGNAGGSGQLTRPQFEGRSILAGYTRGARAGAPAGQSFATGLALMDDTSLEPGGLLLSAQHRYAIPGFRIQTMAGFFGSPGAGARERFGAETSFDWAVRPDLRWNARAGSFDRYFRLPTPAFGERNSRLLTTGLRFTPRSWLSLSASHAVQEYRGDEQFAAHTNYLTSFASLFQLRHEYLHSLGLTVSFPRISSSPPSTEFLFDARGSSRLGSWFLAARKRTLPGSPLNVTLGKGARTRFGTGQLTGSWQDTRFASAALHWTYAFLPDRSLQITGGLRYGRSDYEPDPELLGTLRIAYNFLGGHGVDLSVDQQPRTTSTRMQWRGRVLFPESRGAGAGGGPGTLHVSSVEGRVYLDRDANGRFDGRDRGLPNVAVLLDGGVARSKTDEEGRFRFEGIRAGAHRISVEPRTIRADLSLLDSLQREVVVPAFKTVHLEFRACVNRKVTGVVFRDLDGDGEHGAGEPALAEVRLLVPGAGDTISNPDGRFRIADLPPGAHTLVVDESSLDEDDVSPGAIEFRVSPDGDPEPIHVPIRKRPRDVRRKVFD